MADRERRRLIFAHQEWLGFVQPVGLVVSPPVMVERTGRDEVQPTSPRYNRRHGYGVRESRYGRSGVPTRLRPSRTRRP